MSQGRDITTTKERITPQAVGRAAAARVDVGTVLLSFKLSIGKVGIARVPLYTNEAIAALPVRQGVPLVPEFLAHSLEAMDLAGGANRAAMGATLNKASLALIPIPLPPLAEQRRIAGILDAADRVRSKVEQTLNAYVSLEEALFRTWVDSSPTNTRSFGELISHMRNGLSPSSTGSVAGSVLTLSAITSGRFDAQQAKEALFDRAPKADQYAAEDDFLICRGNGNRDLVGVGVFAGLTPGTAFPDTIIAARVDPHSVTREFLELAWRSKPVRDQVLAAARTTSGIFKVNQQMLSAVLIDVPEHEEQVRLSERVGRLRVQRERLVRSCENHRELAASLQSRAFNGEL